MWFDIWRNGKFPFAEYALPFPSKISWRRIVVPFFGDAKTLLRLLQSFSDSELEARRAYMRSVAHWLVFDMPSVHGSDAAAAAIDELVSRVRATNTL